MLIDEEEAIDLAWCEPFDRVGGIFGHRRELCRTAPVLSSAMRGRVREL